MAGYDFDEARRLAQSVGVQTRPPLPDDTRNLSEMNLEEELVAQYNAIKRLQAEVMNDPDVPANQKAQVANAVAATIRMLVDTQTNFYTHERQKRLEGILIRCMKAWPVEQAQAFLDLYAAELTNEQ
jgi:Tfp pilus assembly PilM family ATPase